MTSVALEQAPNPPGDRGGAGSPLEYVPQIDTLRAFAVGTVFLDHYAPRFTERYGSFDGVLLFFVISGFLITGILLRYRDSLDARRAGLAEALRVFYARRTLRIFPVYYALILIMLVVGTTRALAPWHLTYTTNIWSALHNSFAPDAGHFWSLSVEEQFYLLWPLVVLTAPRRWLPAIMLAGVAGSLAFRVLATYLDWGLARRTLMVGNLHSLLGGGLLAWAHHNGFEAPIRWLRRYGIVFVLALPMAWIDAPAISVVGRALALTLCSIYLVDQCVKGYSGWLGRLMSFPFLLYLGTISYGLYLFHPLVKHWIGTPFDIHVANVALWTIASVVMAALSWHFFEKPINGLKSRFRIARVSAAGTVSETSRDSIDGAEVHSHR